MFTTQDILKLRKATQAGMMDCKNALQQTQGNFEKAIEFLRKKGKKIAAKRATRATEQGAVFAKVNSTNNLGVILVLGCETDFVARNDTFEALGNTFAKVALQHEPTTIEALLALKQGHTTLQEKLTEAIGTLGENLSVTQYSLLKAPLVGSYVHTGNWLGALVGLDYHKDKNVAVLQASKDIAIQVVVTDPLAVDEKTLDPSLLQKEKAIIIEALKQEGKLPTMVERIAQGKVNKFIKESTLLAQPFVKDNTQTVAQYLKGIADELTISNFKRVAIAR